MPANHTNEPEAREEAVTAFLIPQGWGASGRGRWTWTHTTPGSVEYRALPADRFDALLARLARLEEVAKAARGAVGGLCPVAVGDNAFDPLRNTRKVLVDALAALDAPQGDTAGQGTGKEVPSG